MIGSHFWAVKFGRGWRGWRTQDIGFALRKEPFETSLEVDLVFTYYLFRTNAKSIYSPLLVQISLSTESGTLLHICAIFLIELFIFASAQTGPKPVRTSRPLDLPYKCEHTPNHISMTLFPRALSRHSHAMN